MAGHPKVRLRCRSHYSAVVRYQIIAALAQDGLVYYQIHQGSTDHQVFEEFIERLLQHCGRWPEPKSVLIMDNALFHKSERIKELARMAGVLFIFLPPYSPDQDPIEEKFSQIKAFARRHWQQVASMPYIDFGTFLDWCIRMVGGDAASARGFFRHAGIFVEDP